MRGMTRHCRAVSVTLWTAGLSVISMTALCQVPLPGTPLGAVLPPTAISEDGLIFVGGTPIGCVPGPGGAPVCPLPVPVEAGDVQLLEGPGGPVEDLVRFLPTVAPTVSTAVQLFSEIDFPPDGQPSDVGIPADRLPNVTTIVESSLMDSTEYVAGSATYFIQSDRVEAVPEPGVISLLAAGACVLAGCVWRKRRTIA